MSTVTRGTVAELVAAAELTKQGFAVSLPISHTNRYDLIVDNGLSLKKVQVKRVYESGKYKQKFVEGRRLVARRNANGGVAVERYIENDYDFLIAVEVDTNTCWVLPFAIVKRYKAQIYLGGPLEDFKNQWLLVGVEKS